MNKINKPKENTGKNKSFLNNIKFYVAMSLAITLGNNAFSQNNINKNTRIEYKVNKINLDKYQSMINTRDRYISQTDNTYMDPNEYFVLNQKKMFLKSYETNRENVKTYVDKIKKTLNNKFSIKAGNDPINIIKISLETISNREDMDELKHFINLLDVKFDKNLINTYGYIQSMFPETWREVGGETLPTWRLDGETLKRILSLLENGEYTVNYEDIIRKKQELNGNVKEKNTEENVEEENQKSIDENIDFVTIGDLDLDKHETEEKEEIVVDESKSIINKNEIDRLEEENQKPTDESIEEDDGFIDIGDLKGEKNNKDNNSTIKNKKEKELADEGNMEEKKPEEDVEEENQKSIDENIEGDDGFIDIWDLKGDKSGSTIKKNEKKHENKITNEKTNKEKNSSTDTEVLNPAEEMKIWIEKELEKNLSDFDKVSYSGNTIKIILSSPNYESIIKEKLEKDLGPFLQAIKRINFIEDDDGKINKIDMERDIVETLDINENMSVIYNFNYELRQNLPLNEQKKKIIELMKTYPLVNSFVLELEKVGINMGENYGINRTSAILRAVNGNFEIGNQMLNLAIEGDIKGSNAVGHIILQSWAMNLDDYQINLKYNDSKQDKENKGNEKISLPVTEDMFEANKKEREMLKIVNTMSWTVDILSQNLDKNKLEGINYQEIIDVVNGFESKELKKAFMFSLLNNDIIGAQELMGMSPDCDYRYNDYVAGEKLGEKELNKIKKMGETRKYMGKNEILNHKYIPQDVKTVYEKFENGEINNKNKPYNIISKTDFRLYMFSSNHKLLAYQNVLLGKDVGDKKNNPAEGVKTTPGGIYEIGRSFDKSSENNQDFFKKYGTHYIVLVPTGGQYNPSNNYTMGVHGLYKLDPSRKNKIKSKNSKDRRASNGCINIEDFGEIYNQFELGGILYVTYEPDKNKIEEYIRSKN